MNCPACAHKNPDGAKFCSECAAPLTQEAACLACGSPNPPGSKFCNECAQPIGTSAKGEPRPASTPTPRPAPALPATFGEGRYQVKGFLGEGGRKKVYLAHDSKLDRDVAVAIIKTDGLDEAGLSRVKREAQAMGRLGDHPNIVTIHDIGDENGQPFIVSQYMAGGALEDVLHEQEAHRLPLDRALPLAQQVSLGLAHAHGQGVIHRDIKPGNIWLTRDGTAKLGDFGLAVALDRSRLTMAGTMVGTAAYMPPEQALGGQADARSDLYSLGCVIYEMLTGRPPFLGDDTLGIISQHINTAPIATTWHNPAVPVELDELVIGLLAKLPEERPVAAADVASALAALAAAPAPVTAGEAPPASAAAQVRGFRRGPFVGREKELAQLKERFEDALSEHGLLVMLVGEPGIGKTRMAEELSVYARLRGAQALTGQCYETEGAPPYIPFVEALRQYVNSRPAEDLRREMGDGASDLAKLVSEVRTRVPDVPSGPEQEPESERYRLLEAVTSFLINASKSNPLLLILDDLHWADKPTLLLLEHLARRLSGARILVVGTYRDVELDRRHPLSEVIADLRRERIYERILVRGLDPDGVRAMLAGRGAMSGRPEQYVNPALSDALYEQTEGNPFFIEEIILHLVDVGALYRKEGQWQIRMSALAEHIPEGVREVIGRRLSRLSAAANEALSFASVIGREFDFDVLQALSEMEDETLLAALEEALGAQLINEQKTAAGTAYRFSHALVQETLYGELSIARKQRVHLRAGRALEHARVGRLEAHVGQLAYHFHQGNDAGKAMEYSRQAGDAAARVYAWEEAIRHWQTALELMEEQKAGSDEERARLLERLGDVIYVSGIDFEKGAQFLERALALYEAMGARGKVAAMHSRMGRSMVSYPGPGMDLVKGPEHLEAARKMLEEDAPDSPGLAYAYIGLASGCMFALHVERGLECARRGLEIGEKLNSVPVIANALAFVGWFLCQTGRLRDGLSTMERAWTLAQEQELTFVSFIAAGFLGPWNGGTRRDPQTGKRWLQEELERPAVAASRIMREYLLGNLVFVLVEAGEVAEARALFDAGGLAGPGPTRVQIAEGDWAAAEERMRGVIESARTSDPAFSNRGITELLGEFLLTARRYDEAEEQFRIVLEIDERSGARAWDIWPRLAICRLLAISGRLEEAREHLDWVIALLAEGEDWGGTVGLVALASGTVAAAEQNWGQAETAFEEALTVARQYGLPWDEADALHERARMHLARDEKDDRRRALSLFDETITIYQRLGAKKHLELVLADKLATQGIESTDIHTSIDRVVAAVQSEHPDLKPHAAPDGTVTIMFSDIEGHTEKVDRLGDKAWMEVLREHNAIIREQIKANAGFEVKSEGDGFMVAFQSAGKALNCASAVQRVLAERNASADELVMVRMGVHAGEVIKEGEDFFGRNVIMASRVASRARGGEILASSVVKALVQGSDVAWGEKRTVELKGLSGEHEIWLVEWSLRGASLP